MQSLNILIGAIVLILGIPIGNFLAKITKEELKEGKPWFKLIVFVSLISALISLYFRNDYLLFTFLFIAIVTSRSLSTKR
jgi:hypothetical protein